MHAKRVAVACAVTCAVALSAVPLAAQVPAREHRVGIGISFPDVGLFLPINVSSHVRLEPFVNFKSTRTDYDITPNFDTVWTSYTQVGLGILSVMHPDDRLSLYFGPRGGLLRASYKQNGTGSQSEEKDTGSFIAATVGAEFAGYPGEADVDGLAAELAGELVGRLRTRLDDSLREALDDDATELDYSDRVSSAYREFKGHRVEAMAADSVAAAFGRGQYGATPDGTRLRWVVDDGDAGCPDCDDDALAGPTTKGEAFPTGQAHPPAHPGCRCLLVPADA